MTLEQTQDWACLDGRNVEIRREGKNVDLGKVDLVSLDGTVLWLAADGADSRRLYAKAERYEAFPAMNAPEQDCSTAHHTLRALQAEPAQ